ncbi:Fumarate hydratase class II [compost metagenome]
MNGQLELNAFSPLIAESLLESLEVLTKAVALFEEKCIRGLEADADRSAQRVEMSSALAAALVDYIGYEAAARIAKQAQAEGISVREVLIREGLMTAQEAERILSPRQITKPGIPGK